MPECNICRSPYLEGQAFCRTCGARFSLEQPDRAFCFRCGAKVMPHQEKCPVCAVSLIPQSANYLLEEPVQPRPARLRLFLYGVFTGLGVVMVIFSGWIFVGGGPGNRITPLGGAAKQSAATIQPVQGVLKPELRGPAAAAASEPAGHAALKSQLEALLSAMKEANQKKDLDAFMNAYSPNFAHLAQKKRNTQRIWALYDFPEMKYHLEEAELLAPDRAYARVKWDIASQNRWTKKTESVTLTYRVWFTKEPVQWRIQNLEKENQTTTGNGDHEIVGR